MLTNHSFALLILMLTFSTSSLAKRYGCHTSISIQLPYLYENDEGIIMWNFSNQTVPVAYMNSRRGCKAGDSDFTCRRKARNQAKVCAEALIHSTKSGIPKNCNSNMTGQVPYAWSTFGGQNALRTEAHYFWETLNGFQRYTTQFYGASDAAEAKRDWVQEHIFRKLGKKVPFKVVVRTWWGGGTDGQTAWYDIDWDLTPSSNKAAAKACKGKWVFDGTTSKYDFLKLKPGKMTPSSGRSSVTYGGAKLSIHEGKHKRYKKSYMSSVNSVTRQLRMSATVTPVPKLKKALIVLGKTLKKNLKKKWKSEAFAPLEQENKTKLMRAHDGEKKDYKGCGRHAAKHVLDFLGHKPAISVVGKYVPFSKGVMAVELAKRFFNSSAAKQKATWPDTIVQGVNRYLRDKKDKVRVVRKTMNRKNPPESIRTHIPEKGPIIALVLNGAHYVTAMGYWEPLFSGKHRLTSFYTFDNAHTKWHPAGYFSLKFNKITNTVRKFASGKHPKSWRPGTLIYLKSNK